MLVGVLVLAAIVSQWSSQVARATGTERLAEAHRHANASVVIAGAGGLDDKLRVGATTVTDQGEQ